MNNRLRNNEKGSCASGGFYFCMKNAQQNGLVAQWGYAGELRRNFIVYVEERTGYK